MALTAIHYVDPANGWPFELTVTQTGQRGVRAYFVNTQNIENVLDLPVSGLPAIGDSWSLTRPDLKVVALRPQRVGGQDGPEGEWGTCRVVVEYSSGSIAILNAGKPDEKYSVLSQNSVSFTAMFGLNESDEPDLTAPQINNGNGVSVDAVLPEVRVRRFYPKNQFGTIDWARLNTLSRDQALNDGTITLPAPQHIGGDWYIVSKGQARYRGYALVDAAPNAFGIEHTMLLAPDHKSRWTSVNDQGFAVATREARVLPFASFANLW